MLPCRKPASFRRIPGCDPTMIVSSTCMALLSLWKTKMLLKWLVDSGRGATNSAPVFVHVLKNYFHLVL